MGSLSGEVMGKKKTVQNYYRLARERGFEWIGSEFPRNIAQKTRWQCSEGHEWEVRYNSIQQGSGCPYCAIDARRKKEQDYQNIANEREFEWIGKKLPPNTGTKTAWRCPEGHVWEACYSNIQQGTGCPHCAGLAWKIEQDYYNLAKERNYEWIGKLFPKNVLTKTWWKCQKGHKWETSYSHIRQGSSCPICVVDALRKTKRDYHFLAKEQDLKWLGPEVSNNQTKTWWECSRGHKWETCYGHIQQGGGCPYCANRVPKTFEDYHELAGGRGFRWVGKEFPRNVLTKTKWQCSKGHEWKACYHDLQQGSGCPHCAGLFPKAVEDYHELAKERDFEWVGEKPPRNIHTKTRWRCPKNHEWEAVYSNIQRGTGCPHCIDMVNGHYVSKPQRQIHKMVGGVLNHPYSPYNIDVALLDKMIAVEYDCWYWHGHRQEQDAKRDEDLLAAGWKVLHIKTNVGMPSKQELDGAIAKLENGERQVEIVLNDWGKGPTFAGASPQ